MSGDSDDVELTKDDKRTLKQLLADYRDSSVTRRAAMGGTAAILGGAAFGAGRVTAQPDGSPSVIGQETDRTDLWGDQIDANVVDTDDVVYSSPNTSVTGTGRSLEFHWIRHNLSDTAKAQLLDVAKATGVVTVVDVSTGKSSKFQVRAGEVAQKIWDPANVFSTTEDNGGTVNIYWDSTNSRYEINNETNTTGTYEVLAWVNPL